METGLETFVLVSSLDFIPVLSMPSFLVLFIVCRCVFHSRVCFSLELFVVFLVFYFARAEVEPELEINLEL